MKGSVSSIEQKGKQIFIKWQEPKVEGSPAPKEIELLYSVKTLVRIKAPGTASMVEPGSIVGADLVENSTGELYGSELLLFMGIKQGPSIERNPEDPSKYRVVGQIESINGTRLMMNFGQEGSREVIFDGEPVISTIAERPEFLKKGAKGQIEYIPSKDPAKPAALVAMEVTREEPLDPEELHGTNVAKIKTPTSKPPSKTSSTVKGGGKPVSKPAKPKDPAVKDPFGVLN